jgi:hypothetical protein
MGLKVKLFVSKYETNFGKTLEHDPKLRKNGPRTTLLHHKTVVYNSQMGIQK